MRTGFLAAAGTSLVLAACGGGGGDSGSSGPTLGPSAEGLYNGTVNDRQATVLVTDDGRFYSEYAVAGTSLIAGVVTGTVVSVSGSLPSGTGTDYNYEGQGTNSVSLSGSYSAKQSIKATIAYSGGVKSAFSGSYDTSYDAAPSQAAVSGTFKGTSATNIGSNVALDSVTLTADAAGNITGNGTNCAFTGTIRPHAKGNLYDVGLTFGSGSGCAYPSSSATGLGVMNGNVIHAFVQTPSKAGVLFVGTKQVQ
ncbi:hypothetical protein [Caballeronia arationis]|jgi:hypothetical protein|nr:hypothetical protein [Caballeronia arationis]